MNLPALFIGRFQPFHIGHMQALKSILSENDNVYLALGSTQESHTLINPLTPKERKQIIELALKEEGIAPFYEMIYEVPDINNDKEWVGHVESILPEFGAVYSGSDFVQKLFREHGEHEVKDVNFLEGVSATLIRDKVLANEDWSEFVAKATYEYLRQIDFEDRLQNCLEKGSKKS